jgi:hypothetical protein
MSARKQNDPVIAVGELYRLDQVKRRLGLGEAAWREMVKRGLPYIRVGKRVYLVGEEVIEFLKRERDHANESICDSPQFHRLHPALEAARDAAVA